MSDETNIISCCGRVLWTEVIRELDDGQLEVYLLLPNDMMAIEYHGCCLRCGTEWHWTPPMIRLRRIMARRSTWTME